jgi:hypothetical protein
MGLAAVVPGLLSWLAGSVLAGCGVIHIVITSARDGMSRFLLGWLFVDLFLLLPTVLLVLIILVG